MPKIAYQQISFNNKSSALIHECNVIIAEYLRDGVRPALSLCAE